MIIVYAPKGGEQEHFDARSLRVSEAQIVQRITGKKWGEIQQGVQEDDPEAMRAVAWVVRKRSQPSLGYDDFDPGIEELYTRLDKDEVTGWVERGLAVATQNPAATTEEIRVAMSGLPELAFDREHAERVIDELVADPKDGAVSDQPTETLSTPPSGIPTSLPSEPGISDSSPTSSTSPQPESTT